MIFQEHIPLADKNWFETGGSARYFCEPSSSEEFKQALEFAKTHNLPIFVLGSGANIVISDDGFDGLIIHPKKSTLFVHTDDSSLVTASAGITMNELIEYTLDQKLTGLEVFSNIPGTVGGSVYINLHYFEYFLSHFLVSGQVINTTTCEIVTVDLAWFNFGYDQSTLMNREYYLIDATFKLKQSTESEVTYARGRRFEIIRHRVSRYPRAKTCGSFFRNFHDDEVTLVWEGKKMKFVAFYLDKIGVKGTEHVGGAWVSSQHANMLVNKENATSSDIVQLARILQEKVQKEFGIIPQPECIFLGFKKYPLL